VMTTAITPSEKASNLPLVKRPSPSSLMTPGSRCGRLRPGIFEAKRMKLA
jgi:hypothetical protein